MMKSGHLSNKQGSASVIVIMVMLLLVVFGILAFVSGGSSLKLAEKNASAAKSYYLLDKKGEIAVGQISDLLKSDDSLSDLDTRIRTLTGINDVSVQPHDTGNPVITVQIQDLSLMNGASLRIRLQEKSGPMDPFGLDILEWKLINKPFDYGENVNLWDGGS